VRAVSFSPPGHPISLSTKNKGRKFKRRKMGQTGELKRI
jgi:hypothetical protein